MQHHEVTKLYKYRTFSARNLSMLANNEIFFAPSNVFNDPLDCPARKEMDFLNRDELIAKMAPLEVGHRSTTLLEAIQYVESRTTNETDTKAYLDEKSKMFQKVVLQTFGIFSVSATEKDILMWSHYSDGHTGFCIEFNREPDNFLNDAKPVEYPETEDFPFIDYWAGDSSKQIKEFKKIVLTKSIHWDYEEEWRALGRPDGSDPDTVDLNYSGHVKEIPDDTISGIIFGNRMKKKNRNTVRNILTGRNVKWYEANIVKNKFLLEINELHNS